MQPVKYLNDGNQALPAWRTIPKFLKNSFITYLITYIPLL
jgi:hypothetical protein